MSQKQKLSIESSVVKHFYKIVHIAHTCVTLFNIPKLLNYLFAVD